MIERIGMFILFVITILVLTVSGHFIWTDIIKWSNGESVVFNIYTVMQCLSLGWLYIFYWVATNIGYNEAMESIHNVK